MQIRRKQLEMFEDTGVGAVASLFETASARHLPENT